MAILTIKDAKGKEYEIPAIRGKDGKSAYIYAKEHGYLGTEEEFAVLLSKMDLFTTKEEVEQLIDEKLGVIENGSY